MNFNTTGGHLTDPRPIYHVGDELCAGVITMAVIQAGQRPGIWQDMIQAAQRGVAETKEKTVSAFLFQAMVDRLLEEFYAGEAVT